MCLELALSGRGILFLILFLPSVPSEMATEMARSPALHPPSPPPLPQQCRQQQQRQEPEYFRSRVSYGRMIRRTWQPAWQSAPNSWSRPCLLIASGFCTALGVGYQAVAIAGWLQVGKLVESCINVLIIPPPKKHHMLRRAHVVRWRRFFLVSVPTYSFSCTHSVLSVLSPPTILGPWPSAVAPVGTGMVGACGRMDPGDGGR